MNIRLTVSNRWSHVIMSLLTYLLWSVFPEPWDHVMPCYVASRHAISFLTLCLLGLSFQYPADVITPGRSLRRHRRPPMSTTHVGRLAMATHRALSGSHLSCPSHYACLQNRYVCDVRAKLSTALPLMLLLLLLMLMLMLSMMRASWGRVASSMPMCAITWVDSKAYRTTATITFYLQHDIRGQ